MTISFTLLFEAWLPQNDSTFAPVGFLHKAFDKARPAAIDIFPHRSARIRAHGLKLVVQEFDARRVRPVGGKAHFAAELCRLENVALQMKRLHRSKWSNTTWPAKIGISARRPSVNNSRARVHLHGHPRKVARRF